MPSSTACQSLRTALAQCERATAGRCPATSKACDKHRDKLRECEAQPAPPAFEDASCGLNHCLSIAKAQGVAFSWALHGDTKAASRFGQLGWGAAEEKRGVQPNQRKPMVMPNDAGAVISVAAGDQHSVLATASGDVFVCGSDRWLQLGQDQFWSQGRVWQREPTVVPSLKRRGVQIVQVAAGTDHTIALDAAGKVWAFGNGEHGQLFGESQRPFTSPPAVSMALSHQQGPGQEKSQQPRGAREVWARGHCSCAQARATGLWRCIGKCAGLPLPGAKGSECPPSGEPTTQ